MSGEKMIRLSDAISSVMAVESECARSGRYDAAYACARIARMIEHAEAEEDPSEANKQSIRAALSEDVIVSMLVLDNGRVNMTLPRHVLNAARAAVGLEPL